MKRYSGLEEIITDYKRLPSSGWVGVKDDFFTRSDLKSLDFYVPESLEDKIDIEDNYEELIEAPTLKDVIDNKMEHHPEATLNELLSAVIYYLNNDDFED